MTAGRCIALVAAIAACGARPPPPPPPAAMSTAADDATSPTPYTVALTIASDAAGRVTVRLESHGRAPVAVVLPERPDQIEWFEPDARRLAEPGLRVMWTGWRPDRAELAGDSRPAAAQRASRHVALAPGAAEQATVDLGAVLEGGTAGWCVRAWLVGGAHPLASNVVCWPARPT